MNKERLQEIKDSIDFQREILIANNMGTLCMDEEKELYDEVVRLNNVINELEKWLKGLIDNFNEDVSEPILHEQMTINLVYDYLENLKELKDEKI